MRTGDRVEKVRGYPFAGTVQSVFTNRAGHPRVVVELDRSFPGDLLHIFSPEQVTPAPHAQADTVRASEGARQ